MNNTNQTIADLPSHPFWEFSLATYPQTAVKQGCLALQERVGMNVNIILFICWLAKTGRGRLQKDDFIKIARLLNRWHLSITQCLRHMRRLVAKAFMPTTIQTCKQVLLTNELAAEQIEQLMLANYFTQLIATQRTTLQKATDAVISISTYAKSLGIAYTTQDSQAIEQILMHIFPKIATNDLKQICEPLY